MRWQQDRNDDTTPRLKKCRCRRQCQSGLFHPVADRVHQMRIERYSRGRTIFFGTRRDNASTRLGGRQPYGTRGSSRMSIEGHSTAPGANVIAEHLLCRRLREVGKLWLCPIENRRNALVERRALSLLGRDPGRVAACRFDEDHHITRDDV